MRSLVLALVALIATGGLLLGASAVNAAVSNEIEPEVVVLSSTEVGQPLLCAGGSWAGPITEFQYRWLRNGSPISGANTNTYDIKAADRGYSISCVVTVISSEGDAEEESSNSVRIEGAEPLAPPESVERPAISPPGNTAAGDKLTCSSGTWNGNPPPTFAYRWLREEAVIAEAEGSSYTVQPADEGHSLRCEVTASNSQGTNSVTSEPVHVEGGGPPVDKKAPVVEGPAAVGETLTCSPGEWSGEPTFTYQWLREKTAIASANGRTFTVEPGDEGQKISCAVTAKNAFGSGGPVESGQVTIGGSKPADKELPKIEGTPAVGKTLTCAKGSWTGSPTPEYEFQWLLGETQTPIGTKTDTYLVATEDRGQELACQVTAKNSLGSVSVSSLPVVVPEGSGHPLVNKEAPLVSETLVEGVLTCSDGRWEPAATSYAVEWLRDEGGKKIAVATGESYTVQPADVGFSLSCRVKAVNSEGSGEAESSNSEAIAGSAPQSLSAPMVSSGKLVGPILEGETLTCTSGDWSGAPAPTYTYKWLREGKEFGAEAKNSYVVKGEDLGEELSCEVTAKNSVGSGEEESVRVYVQGSPPVPLEGPEISGETKLNAEVTCSTGQWAGKPTPKFSYQWLLEGTAIASATTEKYTVTTADQGRDVSCKVTAKSREGEVSATSKAQHIQGVGPRAIALPQISGSASVGQPLTCLKGTWEGKPPPTFTYQWTLDDSPIAGATASTYTVEPAAAGQLISCVVRASNGEGSYEAESVGLAVPYTATKTGSSSTTPGYTPTTIKLPTPRLTATEILDALRAQLPHAEHGARIASVLKGGAYSFSFAAPEAGTLQVFWYEVPKGAHVSANTKIKPVLVASATTAFSSVTKKTVKLHLTNAGRGLLEQRKQLKLTVKAVFTSSRGVSATWLGTLALSL